MNQKQGGQGFGGFPQQGGPPPQQQYPQFQQPGYGYEQDYSQMDPNYLYQQQLYQQQMFQGVPGPYPPQMFMQPYGYPQQFMMDPYGQGAMPYYGQTDFSQIPGQEFQQQGFQNQSQQKNYFQEQEQFPSLQQQQNVTAESLAVQQRKKQLSQQLSVQDSLARNTGIGSSDSASNQLKQQKAGQQKPYLTKSQKKQLKRSEKEKQEKEEQEKKQLEEIQRRKEEEKKKQEFLVKKQQEKLKKAQEEAAKKAQQEELARKQAQDAAKSENDIFKVNDLQSQEASTKANQKQVIPKTTTEQSKKVIPEEKKKIEPVKEEKKKIEPVKEEKRKIEPVKEEKKKIEPVKEEKKKSEPVKEEKQVEEEEEEEKESEEEESDEEDSLASDEEYVTDSESDEEEKKKSQLQEQGAKFQLKVTAQEWVPGSLRHIQKENVNFTVVGVNINEEDRIKIESNTQDLPQEDAQKKKKKKKRKIVKKKPKKQLALQDTEQLKIVDPDETRKPCNLVFIGHVDVGKSTICGNILFLTGKVDKRTIEKYEIEAKEKGRDSWWLAYVMDINEEERNKGKTIEVGRANFETKNKRVTILDAPGHEKYVPNMIQGACQADYGALIISARSDEFEAGFDRGGQTREHAVLARSLGIEKLIICINKMDDPSVNWSEDRYLQIRGILEPFLEQLGYNLQRDINWIPCSGLNGINIIEKSESLCPWYKGPCFMELLDSLELPQRYQDFVRIPIIDRMKAEVGVNFFGKIESGKLNRNQEVLIYPTGIKCNVVDIYTIYDNEDKRLSFANAGENIRFKLSTTSKHIHRGFVICTPENPVPIVKRFEANMQILDHVEHKPIISAGYQCILHVHTAMEECVISQMLFEVDIKTKKTKKINFAKDGQYVIAQIEVKHGVCMEIYKTLPYFGRFTLRDEGKTIAIGKLTKIIEGKEPEGASDEEVEGIKEEEDEDEDEENEGQKEQEETKEENVATQQS